MSGRAVTPLWVIVIFLSLAESVLGVAASQTSGGIQVALTSFVIAFPMLVAGAFFAILWYRPYVFYPPKEFSPKTDVTQYVDAMRSRPAQETETTRILRCYLGVKTADLPEVWTHADDQGLFSETHILAEMKGLYEAAIAPTATVEIREQNLRKAHRQYASEIAIVEGTTPVHLAKLSEHRKKVCEIARR